MPRMTIAGAVTEELARHRAMRAHELGPIVAARGLTRARNPTQAVSRALATNPDFRRLADDRWVVPAQLLRGATLTHRLTAAEAESGALALMPDLAPLASLAHLGLLRPDGRPFAFRWDAEARKATGLDTDLALEGPRGWLPDAPGTILHVRLTGSILRVAPGPEPEAAAELAVRRLIESCRARLPAESAQGRYIVVPLEEFMLVTLVDEPDLLVQPLPPLGEALTAAGLEVHREWVGPPGTDWDWVEDLLAFDRDDWLLDDLPDDDLSEDDDPDDLTDEEIEAQMVDVGLEPEEVEGFRIVLGAYDLSKRMGGIDDAKANASLAKMFASPGITRMLTLLAWRDPELESFVAPIAQAARGPDAAGPRLVLGVLAEAGDDVVAAERAFRSALEADSGHPIALVALAPGVAAAVHDAGLATEGEHGAVGAAAVAALAAGLLGRARADGPPPTPFVLPGVVFAVVPLWGWAGATTDAYGEGVAVAAAVGIPLLVLGAALPALRETADLARGAGRIDGRPRAVPSHGPAPRPASEAEDPHREEAGTEAP